MNHSGEGLLEMSALGLEHIGDAVYELMVRTWLCTNGATTAKNIHKETILRVSAKAQAAAAESLLPELSESELAIFKRGRNAHVNTVPRTSTYEEYHTATGLEALFGHLYLEKKTERLEELFDILMDNVKCKDIQERI